jgi:hypothetical protein
MFGVGQGVTLLRTDATPRPSRTTPAASALEQEKHCRPAQLVRAAALLLESGVPAAEPESWQARELLGSALYRTGKADEAVQQRNEAVRLHGKGGLLWSRPFLALAHECLDHRQEAEQWRQKADKAGPWQEQVMQFHLLGELAAAQKAAKP